MPEELFKNPTSYFQDNFNISFPSSSDVGFTNWSSGFSAMNGWFGGAEGTVEDATSS